MKQQRPSGTRLDHKAADSGFIWEGVQGYHLTHLLELGVLVHQSRSHFGGGRYDPRVSHRQPVAGLDGASAQEDPVFCCSNVKGLNVVDMSLEQRSS